MARPSVKMHALSLSQRLREGWWVSRERSRMGKGGATNGQISEGEINREGPCRLRGDARGTGRPLRSFRVSCPLFDMSGNVWELTRSPYKPYPYDSAGSTISMLPRSG